MPRRGQAGHGVVTHERPSTRAFEASLHGVIPELRTRCKALAGVDADDLLSLTLERGFRYADTYDPTQPVLPWLYTIARRLSLSPGRRMAAPEEGDGGPERIECLDPADVLEHDRFSDGVLRALAALSEPQRKALVLWGAASLSVREVGDWMGVGEEAARSLIRRSVTAFRAAFTNKALRPAMAPA